jgi:hypothetical protein
MAKNTEVGIWKVESDHYLRAGSAVVISKGIVIHIFEDFKDAETQYSSKKEENKNNNKTKMFFDPTEIIRLFLASPDVAMNVGSVADILVSNGTIENIHYFRNRISRIMITESEKVNGALITASTNSRKIYKLNVFADFSKYNLTKEEDRKIFMLKKEAEEQSKVNAFPDLIARIQDIDGQST